MKHIKAMQAVYAKFNPTDGVSIQVHDYETLKRKEIWDWIERCVMTRFEPGSPRILQFVLPTTNQLEVRKDVGI